MSYIGIQPSDINLSSVNITDGSIVSADLANNAVTFTKIAPGAVGSIHLSTTGVSPGTYTKFTVDNKGRVTAGISATTLADYGITDAQALSTSLTNIAALAGTTGILIKTGAATWGLDTSTYLQKNTNDTFTGDLTMAGNIIPLTDVTYTLGSPTKMWKDLYVGPGSIYLNGKKILQDVSSTIVFSTDINQNLRIATSGTGNLELQTDTGGAVLMKATLNISSGKRIIDSAGINVEFGNAINMNSQKITSLATPTQPTDAATKAYVDSASTGDATIVRTTGNQTIAGTKTFSGDVVMNGNLTISGTTTTVNSQTVLLADNVLELNSDFTAGTPTEDSGIQVRRGDLGIVSFIWDEANDRFTMKDGSGGYLPLYTTNTITATTFIGALSGNASTATALQTPRTINGASFNGTANISFTTDAVAEGSSNLYYTNVRAAAAAPVQSVFGRTGAVSLTSGDVTTALTYTPVNKAGDTMVGALTATGFVGPLTGNVTGNVSGTAASETLTTVTGRGATTANFITVASSVSGNFITAYKTGSTYSDTLGAFNAKVDNPAGSQNYFYTGQTNGSTTFSVRADGLVTAAGGFSGNLTGAVTGTASGNLSLGGGTMTGAVNFNTWTIWLNGPGSNGVTGIVGTTSITDAFTYDTNKTLQHYGLTWKSLSDQAAGPSALLTAYGDMRFLTRGIERLRIGSAGNVAVTGDLSSTGLVSAAAANGFTSTTYVANSRNPIWRFGNADAYGLSYFQGTAGNSGGSTTDTIGVHFGTSTAAGSNFRFQANGNLDLSGGAAHVVIGPNTTWGATLYLGGNGRDASIPTSNTAASVVTSDGNLHIDAGTSKTLYLNYYSGTGGVIFGNGASGSNASISAAGVFTGNGSGLTNVTATANPAVIFNNQGQVHATNQDANTMQFGFRHLQSGTNGPGGSSAQYYMNYVGLGSDYDYTQYGHQTAFWRVATGTGAAPYQWYRQREGGAWGAWSKAYAGYADTSGAVAMSAARTDPTAYPVVWATTGGTSQMYSCSAVTIQSSTGTLNATRGVFTPGAIGVGTGLVCANGDFTAYRSGGTTGVVYLTTTGSEYLYYDGTKYVLGGSGALYVGGDITAFSDERLKTNVETIPDALAKVEQIRGVTFNRIDVEDPEERFAGVIAQEVEKVLPEVVRESSPDANGGGGGIKTVAYGNMVGLLIEAIKELNAKVDALQAQLDAKE